MQGVWPLKTRPPLNKGGLLFPLPPVSAQYGHIDLLNELMRDSLQIHMTGLKSSERFRTEAKLFFYVEPPWTESRICANSLKLSTCVEIVERS